MSRKVIVMAAPNGSRWTKADHPALPVTIEETVQEAIKCRDAGASILHAHVRDREGLHVLDAGLYRELLQEMAVKSPGILVQITTEAVGLYSPQEQRNVTCSIKPDMVSVALKEMIPTREDEGEAGKFYAWAAEAGVHVQHILYSEEDARYYRSLRTKGIIPPSPTGPLFVLGRYSEALKASPEDLDPLLEAAGQIVNQWFCCAFGETEHESMIRAMKAGGNPRIGFENNFVLSNGEQAEGSWRLVEQTVAAARQEGFEIADMQDVRQLLWLRKQ